MTKTIKKIKTITLITFLIIIGTGILYTSCQKEENNTNTETTTSIDKVPPGWFVAITVRVQLHRAISERPRDHMPCGCAACFGMCFLKVMSTDVNDDFDAYNGMIIFNLENRTATLDILESVPYAESEFGVDKPIFIPSTYFPDEIVARYSIKEGIFIIPSEYTHAACNRTVAIDSNVSRQSFGEVEMNFSIE